MIAARPRFAVVFLACAAATTTARAQSRTGFAVNRYEPAERGSAWFVVDGLDLHGPAAGATVDYAHEPLVVYDANRNERLALVRHQLFMHVGGAIVVLPRLRLGVSVPVALYQDGEAAFIRGETLSAATAPAFGDVRLAADLRLLGDDGGAASLAVGARAWLPTGLRSQFTSDGSARLSPQLLAGGRAGICVWAARAAFVWRARDDSYAGSPVGSEIDVAGGAGLRIGRFLFGPEAFAETALAGGALRTHGTPADALLGAHHQLPSGLRFSAAIGSGLTHGYGSPAMRALLSVEWTTPIPVLPGDRDRDGVPDVEDACPDWPGPRSGDPEQNGCPPPERVPDEDTDGDGIFDSEDACPGLPGVRTTDPMTNGCPPESPRQLAVVTKSEIKIGEQIQFATDSAELVGDSDAILGAVEKLLDEHPEIRRVRVEGHTDDTGDAAYNDDLSRRRASAVVRWLVEHGVAAERLTSEGYGARKPIDSNATEAGRGRNRRVAFTILERDAKK